MLSDLKFIPERLNTPSIHQAFDMLNEAGMSAEELEQQHKRRDFIAVQRGALKKAKADGKQEGRTEGIEEGRQLEALAMLERVLTRRFGTVPEGVQQRMQSASAQTIAAWFDRAIDAQSLEYVFGETRH